MSLDRTFSCGKSNYKIQINLTVINEACASNMYICSLIGFNSYFVLYLMCCFSNNLCIWISNQCKFCSRFYIYLALKFESSISERGSKFMLLFCYCLVSSVDLYNILISTNNNTGFRLIQYVCNC
jgi:hypothetical protein